MTKLLNSIFLALLLFGACRSTDNTEERTALFARQNLVAWCVVPFDSVERTPAQRAAMLKDLGFTQLAYDWRAKHLPTFPDEIRELQSKQIRLAAVWIWIEPDSTGKILDPSNEKIFEIVRQNAVKTDFWIGFSNANFDGMTDQERMAKAVSAVSYLRSRAAETGSTISLYNHGDWFGEPENQVRIIKASGLSDVGLVYKFHHAHEQLDRYPVLLNQMMPYLRTVNLNGMRADGPKILPIGQGDRELEMLEILRRSKFSGTIGIIGHVEDEDVKTVLSRNIDGLKSLLRAMDDRESLESYH